jgi:uncharacterized membrane protein
MDTRAIARATTEILELAGLAVIAVGTVATCVLVLGRAVRRRDTAEIYDRLRQGIGRTVLLGLEFLIAADIVRTVAVTLTLESVAFLGLIVVIRTFLSFSLEVELQGRWPWQAPPAGRQTEPGDARPEPAP